MDNRSHQETDWDAELLSVELSELSELAVDLALTGFDSEELADLLASQSTGLTDDDHIPPTPELPVSRTGDVWTLGNHRVICGDCTDPSAVQALMNGDRASYTFTSPPYGIDLEYERDQSLQQLVQLIHGAVKSLDAVSTGDAYATMNYADVFLPGGDGFTPMSTHYHEPFSKLGWCLRGNRIWFKPFARLALAYGTSTTMNLREWEYVRTWRKGRGAEKLREHGMTLRGVWKSFGSDAIIPDWKENDLTTDKGTHPAAFPVLLPVAGIRCYTDPHDIVFEPFGGSGTVVIACEKTERYARVVELDASYTDVIVKRWQEYTGREALLASTGQSFDLVANAREVEPK